MKDASLLQQRDCQQQVPQRVTVPQALVTFSRQTSAHGAKRLTQGDSLERAVWCCLIGIGCCGFCVHLSQLVFRYLQFPVSTEFLTDEAELRFPAVTICPTNFIVSMSPTIDSNYTLKGHPRGLRHMINDVPRLYHQLQLPLDWNDTVPKLAFSAYDDGKLALKTLAMRQSRVFQEAHETVIYCRYNSGMCNFANFSIYKDEERFLCLTFSPANRTVVQPGEGNGLYLLLHHNATAFLTNEQQIDTLPGFKIVLHEPGEKPDFSHAFNAPLAYKTAAQLNSGIDYSVNRPSSPCADQLPNVTYTWDYSRPGDFENVTFFGTLQDCVIRAKQMEFARECGCLASRLAMPADMAARWPPCHQLPEEFFFRDVYYKHVVNSSIIYYTITNRSLAYYPLSDYLAENAVTYGQIRRTYRCYKTVSNRQSRVGLATSKCRSRCVTAFHNAITTLYAWPSVNSNRATNELVLESYVDKVIQLAREGNKSLTRLQTLRDQLPARLTMSQFAVVDLYPRSIRAAVSREDWAYPLRNLFSDLGGILGLWIGVSIITLIEVIELIFQLVCLTLQPWSNRVQPTGNRDAAAAAAEAAAGGPQPDTKTNGEPPRDIYSSPSSAAYLPSSALPVREGAEGSASGAEFDVIKYNKSWFQRLFSL